VSAPTTFFLIEDHRRANVRCEGRAVSLPPRLSPDRGYHACRVMNEALMRAVELFNNTRFAEFQDALDSMTSGTRATSERQFYTVLKNVAEALLQLSDGDLADAEGMLGVALRRLEEFTPRFRGLNVAALAEDLQRMMAEIRETRAGRREEQAPTRLPRLRILPE
jgi:hypothetical protein